MKDLSQAFRRRLLQPEGKPEKPDSPWPQPAFLGFRAQRRKGTDTRGATRRSGAPDIAGFLLAVLMALGTWISCGPLRRAAIVGSIQVI